MQASWHRRTVTDQLTFPKVATTNHTNTNLQETGPANPTTMANTTSTPSSAVDDIQQYYWIFGCAAGGLGAIFSIMGMLLMKMGFKDMEDLPAAEQQKYKIAGIPICGNTGGNKWWFGFFLLAVMPLPMDFISLGLASASLVFPFGTAVTVLVGQVLAPMCFDGEKLGRTEWVGTLFVVLGCGLTSAFGDHEARDFTGDEILALYGQTSFIAMFIPLTVLFVVSVVGSLETMRKKVPKWAYFCFIVYIPSYLGGVQTISFKSMSELTSTAATTDGVGEWGSWKPWLFLGIVIPLVIVQLKVVNIGAEFFQATKYFPAYNSGLMVMVVLYGAVFFQEHKALHPIAFPAGVLCLCGGIALLAGKDPTDASAVAASERFVEELSQGDVLSSLQEEEEEKDPSLMKVSRLDSIRQKHQDIVANKMSSPGSGWTPSEKGVWVPPPVEGDVICTVDVAEEEVSKT